MCALDILLFTEAVASADPHMAHLFPVNVLRCRLPPNVQVYVPGNACCE